MDKKCCYTCQYGKHTMFAVIEDVDLDTKTVTLEPAEKSKHIVDCLYEFPKEVVPDSSVMNRADILLKRQMRPDEGTECPAWKEKDDGVGALVEKVKQNFRFFGGGHSALKDDPPRFAAGIDIEDVVRFIIKEAT